MFPATLLIWAVASGWVPPAYLVWAAVGPVLIWLAHADNIDRLIHGTERKFDLGLITGGSRRGRRLGRSVVGRQSRVTAVRFIVTRTPGLGSSRTSDHRTGGPVGHRGGRRRPRSARRSRPCPAGRC